MCRRFCSKRAKTGCRHPAFCRQSSGESRLYPASSAQLSSGCNDWNSGKIVVDCRVCRHDCTGNLPQGFSFVQDVVHACRAVVVLLEGMSPEQNVYFCQDPCPLWLIANWLASVSCGLQTRIVQKTADHASPNLHSLPGGSISVQPACTT